MEQLLFIGPPWTFCRDGDVGGITLQEADMIVPEGARQNPEFFGGSAVARVDYRPCPSWRLTAAQQAEKDYQYTMHYQQAFGTDKTTQGDLMTGGGSCNPPRGLAGGH